MGRVTSGDVLDGRYELVERLGQGGFGVVWRAFDSRMRRPVAVKVINHHGEDQQKAALRFVREACAAGNLSHPHIVTVHDLGEAELGGRRVTYLVMELLTGRTLTAVLRDGPPDPVQSLRWGRQICSALAAAHDAGMVHRDIKPENIMVTEAGTAKVLDFGIAQLDVGAGGLTTTGTVIGSPAYMAPERWTGGRVDGRADLYAFGCVLVELCTGARPFGGDSTPVLMYQHLNEPPPALDPAEFGLPAELAGLVTALLAKDPADRPADARTVERRLAELEEGWRAARPGFGPVVAAAPPVPVGPPAGAVGPVGPAGPAVPPVPVGPVVPGPVPPGALPPVLPPLTTPPLTTPPHAAPPHAAPSHAVPPHAVPPDEAVRAALRERRSAAFRATTPGESAALLQAVAQEAVAALGATDRETLNAWRDFTWFLSRAGDLAGAIGLLSTVAEDMRLALGQSDPDTLAARYHLVRCIGESGETVSAMRRLAQLLPDLHATWGGHDPRVLKARHDLAVYTADRGDLEGAVLQLRTLLPDLAQVLGEQHPAAVQAWQDLAGYQQRLAADPPGRGRRRPLPMHPAEALTLIRRLLVWDFASDREANACLTALERGTGIKQVGDWILSAPDHVTAEDLVDEIYGP